MAGQMMSRYPALERIQQLFFRAITAPRGVADFLEQADEGTRAEFERAFAGSPGFDRVARVDVYANAYFYRLLSALGEMFPRLRRLSGEAQFHNLITDYLLAHPSSSPDLRHAGDRLAKFLQAHELGIRHPMLGEVTAVEAALNRALDCLDGEPLTPGELARVPASEWPELRFELTPPTRHFELWWDTSRALELCDSGEMEAALALEPEPAPLGVLVGRRGHSGYVRRLERMENDALSAVSRGGSLGEVCDELALRHAGIDAANVVGLLGRWLADGVLARRRPGPG